MKEKKNITERISLVVKSHPDMIWKNWTLSGTDDRRYVLTCICPISWTKWPQSKNPVLSEMYTICDGVTTSRGLAIRVGKLERMDWSKADAYAKKAREGLKKIQSELASDKEVA